MFFVLYIFYKGKFIKAKHYPISMKIKEIMHGVTKVPSGTTVSGAAKLMDKKVIGSVLIEEDGSVIGIMTERDILRKVVAKGKNPEEVRAEDIMSWPIITIDASEDIAEASRKFEQHKIRRLIVTEKGQITGIVTANSIAKNIKYILTRGSFITHEEYTRPEY